MLVTIGVAGVALASAATFYAKHALYLRQSSFRIEAQQALRASLPIYVIFFATIAFTIFLPEVVLWLPKHVFPESVGCFRSPAGTGYICP